MGEIGTAPAGTASEGTSEPRAGGGRASPQERAHRRSPPARLERARPSCGRSAVGRSFERLLLPSLLGGKPDQVAL